MLFFLNGKGTEMGHLDGTSTHTVQTSADPFRDICHPNASFLFPPSSRTLTPTNLNEKQKYQKKTLIQWFDKLFHHFEQSINQSHISEQHIIDSLSPQEKFKNVI